MQQQWTLLELTTAAVSVSVMPNSATRGSIIVEGPDDADDGEKSRIQVASRAKSFAIEMPIVRTEQKERSVQRGPDGQKKCHKREF